MNLARLRVFHEVARVGTFSAAADALSYTPSAVSQQMAKLEAEVGAPLLTRSPRGMVLTDAGRALLEHTRTILAEVRAAHAEIDALAGLRAGGLRFGSFPTATQTLGARALRAFATRCPDVRVVLYDDEPHNNAIRLHDREIDLALVFALAGRPVGLDYFGRPVAPDDALMLTPLLDDRFVLVVPTGHRLEHEPATIAALRGSTLIGSAETPGLDQLVEACAEEGFEPSFNGFVCTDYAAVRTLVAAGEGIAVIPGLAAVRPVDGTVTRRLEHGAPRRQVLLARPADGVLSPAANAMAATVTEIAGAMTAVPITDRV